MGNKIIGAVLALTIGVIVLGSVLIPVLEASERTIEPITEYNIGAGHTYREARPGDVIHLVSTYDSETNSKTDVWTLNDKPVTNSNADFVWDFYLASDVVWGQVNSPGNLQSGSFIVMDSGTSRSYFGSTSSVPNYELTITFTEDTISWDSNHVPISGSASYTWAYVFCSLEDGAYRSSSIDARNFIMSDIDDYILCGTYSTGELDTNYWYKDGELVVYSDGITGDVDTNATLRGGTYDLYDVSATVTLTDGSISETFSPYRALVPYEVHGHANSSTSIDLLKVIPIMVIVSLLLMAVSIVARNRY